jgi:hypothetical protein
MRCPDRVFLKFEKVKRLGHKQAQKAGTREREQKRKAEMASELSELA